MKITLTSGLFLFTMLAPAHSAVLVSSMDTPVLQDFNSFNGSGLNPGGTGGALDSNSVKILGMSDGDTTFGGTVTTGDNARGTSSGGVSTGGTYAFDLGGGNIGVGFQPGGTDFTPGSITFAFENDTGLEATSFQLEVDLFYFNDQPRGNTLKSYWSSDDVTYLPLLQDITSPDALGASVWTLGNAVDHIEPGLALAPGSTFYIRFTGDDLSGSGNRDEFAIDNLSITLSGNTFLAQVPEPGSLSLLGIGVLFIRTLKQKRKN